MIPTYHPISMLPIVSNVINQSLEGVKTLTQMLKEAEHQPYLLDNMTVKRAIKQYQDGLDYTPYYSEQLKRWQQSKLTQTQINEVTLLQKTVEALEEHYQQGLDLAKKLSKNTIEQIIEMDDIELALKAMSNFKE